MFGFLNPFHRLQEKKRARLIAEKAIADRMAERAEAEREAKRRKEYADHLEELRQAAQKPRVREFLKREAGEYEPPTYSTPESVSNLLNTISEQSRVTAFEQGLQDIGSVSSSECSSDSGSTSSDSSCSSSSD